MSHEPMRRDDIDRARDVLSRRVEATKIPSLDDVYARAGQRRQRRVVAATAAAALLVALIGWAAGAFAPPLEDRVAVDVPSEEPVMRFADGTRVWAIDETPTAGCCHLEVASEDRVVVRLDEGAARFEVTPGRQRDFVVRAGDVTVHVLGTGFEVDRRGAEVEVNVLHGVVSVTHAGAPSTSKPVRLELGERATFAASSPTVEPVPEEVEVASDDARAGSLLPETEASRAAPEAPERVVKKARSKRDRAWKSRAKAGDFHAAAKLLKGQVDLDDVEELFLAADAMRLTRNHEEALGYLDRILDEHPKDRRAPMAAITRGRIVHGALGDACGAARAFARATKLGARGSLARDALIREAESWRECGEGERARQALDRFVAEHPDHRERAERLREDAP